MEARAPRWEYASCERLAPFGRLVSVQALDVAYEPVDVPGLRRLEPGAAVMVRIELWAPAPTRTFDDYRADRCAADPSA